MLIPLDDDGDFIRVEAVPTSTDPEIGDWVSRLDGDPQIGVGGWVLGMPARFASDPTEGDVDRTVAVEIRTLSSRPEFKGGHGRRVVEMSVLSPAALVGSGTEVSIIDSVGEPWRVRATLDTSKTPYRLVIQSWPSPPAPASVLEEPPTQRTPANPLLELVEAREGMAAGARIGADVDGLDGSRHLSGRVGTVAVEAMLPGRPGKLSDAFDTLHDWSPTSGGVGHLYSSTAGGVRPRWYSLTSHPDDTFIHVTGRHGSIWSTPGPQDDPPTGRESIWRWSRHLPAIGNAPPDREPSERMLPHDTVVRVQLREEVNRRVLTNISLQHLDVPEEWLSDLTSWWKYQLAILAVISKRYR